jgi:Histone-like transcription factor (CBF/NF-Y) and archaeal histone
MDGSEPVAAHALEVAEEPQSTAKPSHELVSVHLCSCQSMSTCSDWHFSIILRNGPQTCSSHCCMQTLPITRVKRIIKQDGEVKAVSTDANYAIAKAAVSLPACAVLCSHAIHRREAHEHTVKLMLYFQEMLLDELVQGAADRTVDGGRNLLSYADVGADPLRWKSTQLPYLLLNANALHVMVT